MVTKLTGALYTFQTHLLYVGALVRTTRHAHHAGQIVWAPDGLVVRDESGAEQRVTTYVVLPNTPHEHGAASAAAVLWVDRDDLQWERALSSPHDVRREFPAVARVPLTASLAPEDARELAASLLRLVEAPQGECEPRHPAVVRMCALLDGAATERDIAVTELAAQSGLSVRQLRHRFTEELGINPRAYLRWRRLRRAVDSIEHGATLTQAAIDGGFADGAHFSRVFQAQFGMPPSQALSSVRFAGPLT